MTKTIDAKHASQDRSSTQNYRRTARGFLRFAGAYRTELTLVLALVLLELMLGLFYPYAWTAGNYTNIVQTAAPLVIVAFGQMLVVVTAGIDLSVGSVFSLSGMVTAAVMVYGHASVPVAVAAGLAVGLLAGAFNGFCVTVVGLAPFVVTLVTYAVAASLAYIVTSGNSLPIADASFSDINLGHLIPGVPNYVLFGVVLLLVLQILMSGTVPGRWLYATGSNAPAARLVGVPTRLVTFSAYLTSGLFAAFAGILSTSYLANAQSTAGTGLELQAIAAVVIGGGSLFGGTGTALGALLGTLIITAVQNGVNLVGINTFWQGTVTGAVILIAVLADRITHSWNWNSRGGLFRLLLPRQTTHRNQPTGGQNQTDPA